MTHSGRYASARQDVKNRVAAALLLLGPLLTTLGWTGDAWGQEKLARVGILTFLADTDDPTRKYWMGLFRSNLADQGWIEGKNVAFEYRNAHSDPSRFGEAAAALVGLKVDVIFSFSAPSLRAAYAATRTIPIVATDYTTDPVAEGYAQSYARPGGNVTGVFLDAPEFAGTWFDLLTAMVPDLSRVSVLWDPGPGDTHLQAVRSVAKLLDIELQVLEVGKPDDIATAFDALRERPQAIIGLPSPMMYQQSARLARLALKHRLPATSMARAFANAGGTIAYGPDVALTIERNAVLVAKALGITVPQSILLRADEVIR